MSHACGPVENPLTPSPSTPPLPLGVVEAVQRLIEQSGKAMPAALLELLRGVVLWLLLHPEGTAQPQTSIEWIEAARCARRLKDRLNAGAVVTFEQAEGGFAVYLRGQEIARGRRCGELALLLLALSGKANKGKGGTLIKLPKVSDIAEVRHIGESLSSFVRLACVAEVQRRRALLDTEGAVLDAADLDDDGEDIARDRLSPTAAVMP